MQVASGNGFWQDSKLPFPQPLKNHTRCQEKTAHVAIGWRRGRDSRPMTADAPKNPQNRAFPKRPAKVCDHRCVPLRPGFSANFETSGGGLSSVAERKLDRAGATHLVPETGDRPLSRMRIETSLRASIRTDVARTSPFDIRATSRRSISAGRSKCVCRRIQMRTCRSRTRTSLPA